LQKERNLFFDSSSPTGVIRTFFTKLGEEAKSVVDQTKESPVPVAVYSKRFAMLTSSLATRLAPSVLHSFFIHPAESTTVSQ